MQLSQRIEEFVHEFGPISLPDPRHYPSYTRASNRFKNYMLNLDDIRVDAKQLHSGQYFFLAPALRSIAPC